MDDHPAATTRRFRLPLGRSSTSPGDGTSDRRGRLGRRAVGVVAGLVVAVTAAQVVDLWWSWRSFERESYETESFEALPPVDVDQIDDGELGELPTEMMLALSSPTATSPTTTSTGSAGDDASSGSGDGATATGDGSASAPPDLDAAYDAYLIVGSDEGDRRADVIILTLLPSDGAAPIMVSLPRDLYLPNRCTGGLTRINANFNGCGPDLNGATQLAGAVEDFTGIPVDHFALFTMDGFEQIIDAVGGMEICVDHPVREGDGLDLPAGCSQVGGESALGWVRSRKTQEFVDGRWRSMPGVNDLTRNERQQDLIVAVMGRVAEFDSPRDLTRFAASLSDAFTLDDRLSLTEAAELAWRHRDLRAGDLRRLRVPVRPHTTSGGAQVLLATTPFTDLLAEID